MSEDSLAELTTAYLGGSASQREQQELLDVMTRSSDDRDHVCANLLVDRLMREMGKKSLDIDRVMSALPNGTSSAVADDVLRSVRVMDSVRKGTTPSRGTKMTWFVRGVLAAAACVAAAVGIFTVSRSFRPVVASVTVCEGTGSGVALGDAIRAGETVSVAEGGWVQLRLPDRSVIDLGERTTITFPAAREHADVIVGKGRIYCAMKKRGADRSPYAVATKSGVCVAVVGTAFELSVDAQKTIVNVERGEVRVHLDSDVSTDVGTEVSSLQRLEVGSDGTISKKENLFLHEIAPWKFRQADVPPGTVLFEDDFESGPGKWDVRRGTFAIRGSGIGDSKCLSLGGTQGNYLFVARFSPRHEDFEISYRLCFKYSMHYLIEFYPSREGDGRPVRPKWERAEIYHDERAMRWYEHRFIVHGRDVTLITSFQGRVLLKKKGRFSGGFAAIGFPLPSGGPPAAGVRMDNFVIRKLEKEE